MASFALLTTRTLNGFGLEPGVRYVGAELLEKTTAGIWFFGCHFGFLDGMREVQHFEFLKLDPLFQIVRTQATSSL